MVVPSVSASDLVGGRFQADVQEVQDTKDNNVIDVYASDSRSSREGESSEEQQAFVQGPREVGFFQRFQLFLEIGKYLTIAPNGITGPLNGFQIAVRKVFSHLPGDLGQFADNNSIP